MVCNVSRLPAWHSRQCTTARVDEITICSATNHGPSSSGLEVIEVSFNHSMTVFSSPYLHHKWFSLVNSKKGSPGPLPAIHRYSFGATTYKWGCHNYITLVDQEICALFIFMKIKYAIIQIVRKKQMKQPWMGNTSISYTFYLTTTRAYVQKGEKKAY